MNCRPLRSRRTLALRSLRPRLRRRRRRPQSEQSCDVGPGWTKRTLPVRLGQEVQALPRPGRLTIGAALRASTRRAEALACLVETFEACGIEDPKREAGITLSAASGVSPLALIVAPQEPLGSAAAEGRGIRGAAGGRRAAVKDRGKTRILGSRRSRFRRRYWIRGPRPKRSSKHPCGCSGTGARSRCASSTSASAQARSYAPCSANSSMRAASASTFPPARRECGAQQYRGLRPRGAGRDSAWRLDAEVSTGRFDLIVSNPPYIPQRRSPEAAARGPQLRSAARARRRN